MLLRRALLPALLIALFGALPASASILSAPLALADTPEVQGTPTADATSDAAVVSASIVPGLLAVTWSVEYGFDTSYGAATDPQTLNPGFTPVPVSARLSGLAADATYHFRIRMTSGAWTTVSTDGQFATASGAIWTGDGEPDPETGDTEAAGHQDTVATPPATVSVPPATLVVPTVPVKPREGETTPGAKAAAALTAASATRTAVRLTVRTARAGTSVRVRVQPKGGRTTSKTYTSLRAGAHVLKVRIPATRAALAVTVTATPKSGKATTLKRTLRPRPR